MSTLSETRPARLRLRVQPLTAEAFAEFGEVIDSAGHTPLLINDGMTERYHALARVDTGGSEGHALINLFHARPYALPLQLTSMERHPLGSQAFMPLDADGKIRMDCSSPSAMAGLIGMMKGGSTYDVAFGNDADALITAQQKATVFVFGGEPLGERHIFWNFVSSRKERIEQAKADWAAGRFALPPDDKDEWIPLPG